MDWIVGSAFRRWRIHARRDCVMPGTQLSFADQAAALTWLRQFYPEPESMTSIRSALVRNNVTGPSVWRLSDDRVAGEVAALLRDGTLHVHRIAPPVTAGRSGQAVQANTASTSSPSAASSSRTSPRAAAPAAAKPEQEPDTFTGNTDAETTAAGMRMAAKSGVPFCEICTKAVAARKAAA